MKRSRRQGSAGKGRTAVEAATAFLAARALTVRELRSKLALRGYPPEQIERTIEELVVRRYLDDRLLAYNLASTLAARRLFGRVRTAAELKRRGVSDADAAEALERAYRDLDENELALAAARKLVPAGGVASLGKRAASKLAASLLRKGLPRGAVAKAVRTLTGEDHELEADT